MEQCINQLKNHFPHLSGKIYFNLDTSMYTEKTAITNQQYNMKFKNEGFSIINFDILIRKSKLKHCQGNQVPCFDVLCVNTDNIKYIELKTTINLEEISGLYSKFYYGYCEAQSLLSILPYKTHPIIFVVVYTVEHNSINPSDDSYKNKEYYINKPHIKEWLKGNIIKTLPDSTITPLVAPFIGNILPITKILYVGDPIELDNY